MSGADDRINPAAYLLARNVKHWDAEPAEHLYEALSHVLASPDPVAVREANLGLVIALISEGTGEFPLIESYERLRAQRRAQGEIWPASSSLIGVYFGWLYVVRAAMEIGLGAARVAHDPKSQQVRSLTYSRPEINEAIRACRREIGFWPWQWEYEEWAYLSRQLIRASGRQPRVPGLTQIRHRYAHFDDAVESVRGLDELDKQSADG